MRGQGVQKDEQLIVAGKSQKPLSPGGRGQGEGEQQITSGNAEKTMPYVDPTEQLVTEIFVRDIARSIDFYRRLGFELVRREGGFAELAWEKHLLFLDQRSKLPPVPEFPAANVRVMVPDVDRYWTLCQEMQARIVAPIGNRYYGLRDFTVADPDGYGVRFASRLEK